MKISIVIITYNRPEDILKLAQNISNLEDIDLLEEVIIVNNNSDLSYHDLELFISEHKKIPFKYYVTEENSGVSKGRNFGINKATAPVIVFLDDDTIFLSKDALLQIQRVMKSETGIVTFKVLNWDTLEIQRTAFPHKQFNQKKNLHYFKSPYFVGCAHGIRKLVFDIVGTYPENFFYGMEEYDLGYRAINAGFEIVYDDKVVVLHKEALGGRLTNKDKIKGMWINKTKVAWKYLPLPYFFSTGFIWSLQYLKKTNGDIIGWVKGLVEITIIPLKEKRIPLHKRGLLYLKKAGARLWY